jgi:hypothetical protein
MEFAARIGNQVLVSCHVAASRLLHMHIAAVVVDASYSSRSYT